MRLILISAALLALLACHQSAPQQAPTNAAAAPAAAGMPVMGVDRQNKGKPGPAATFADPNGKPVKLADFKGKPVLVNLWSITCVPCREELPTLDKLSRIGPIRVLAVNQDSGPHASVVAFLKQDRIGSLEPYQDSKAELSAALGPDTVWPTTMLYDAKGKEVWRYVGPLDWTGPAAARLLAEARPAAKG